MRPQCRLLTSAPALLRAGQREFANLHVCFGLDLQNLRVGLRCDNPRSAFPPGSPRSEEWANNRAESAGRDLQQLVEPREGPHATGPPLARFCRAARSSPSLRPRARAGRLGGPKLREAENARPRAGRATHLPHHGPPRSRQQSPEAWLSPSAVASRTDARRGSLDSGVS